MDMTKASWRFDPGLLRDIAGPTVFARGEDYYRDGRVQLLGISSKDVMARVEGTETYTVRLVGQGGAIRGDCSCPAFEDRGFCKHLVATALAANTGAGEAQAADDPFLRIRQHLSGKGLQALVDMVVDLAARDEVLFRRLDLASAADDEDDAAAAARLGQAIDRAARIRGYVEYEEAQDWAGGVEVVLDAVEDLVHAGRGVVALELIERAKQRIEDAVESIDDSDGWCIDLLERCRDIHLAAALAARPDPVKFARDLFHRELDDEYGVFTGTAELYEEVLGEAGLAAIRFR